MNRTITATINHMHYHFGKKALRVTVQVQEQHAVPLTVTQSVTFPLITHLQSCTCVTDAVRSYKTQQAPTATVAVAATLPEGRYQEVTASLVATKRSEMLLRNIVRDLLVCDCSDQCQVIPSKKQFTLD